MFTDLDGIPTTFLRHAADILGDTQKGLSGTKIIEATAAYAVEFDVSIPHTHMGPHIPNKRTALYDNLRAFSPPQQYKIIKELCDHPSFGSKKTPERKELKLKLITRYQQLDPDPESSEVNKPLIEGLVTGSPIIPKHFRCIAKPFRSMTTEHFHGICSMTSDLHWRSFFTPCSTTTNRLRIRRLLLEDISRIQVARHSLRTCL